MEYGNGPLRLRGSEGEVQYELTNQIHPFVGKIPLVWHMHDIHGRWRWYIVDGDGTMDGPTGMYQPIRDKGKNQLANQRL
jgi:hypothetical protein